MQFCGPCSQPSQSLPSRARVWHSFGLLYDLMILHLYRQNFSSMPPISYSPIVHQQQSPSANDTDGAWIGLHWGMTHRPSTPRDRGRCKWIQKMVGKWRHSLISTYSYVYLVGRGRYTLTYSVRPTNKQQAKRRHRSSSISWRRLGAAVATRQHNNRNVRGDLSIRKKVLPLQKRHCIPRIFESPHGRGAWSSLPTWSYRPSRRHA